MLLFALIIRLVALFALQLLKYRASFEFIHHLQSSHSMLNSIITSAKAVLV